MSRKKKAPKPEAVPKMGTDEVLEAEADKILAADHMDLAAEVRRNTELIEKIYADLRQPSNDPAYLEKLKRTEEVRNNLANRITLLHLVPDRDKLWVSAAFSNAEGETAARLMAEHFECPVQRYDETSQ